MNHLLMDAARASFRPPLQVFVAKHRPNAERLYPLGRIRFC